MPALICALVLLACPVALPQRPASARAGGAADAAWTGVYRIDAERSDKLYSVVAGASSILPFGEQQKFFIDLTVRLTAPDQLAVERRGRRFSIASSRAARVTFEADGVTQRERGGDGRLVTTRAALEGERLTVVVAGGGADRFNVAFEPIDGGRALRVTRRLNADGLNDPVVIRNVYEKISERAEWGIYGEPPRDGAGRQTASADATTAAATPRNGATAEEEHARQLRDALEEWIAATNARDIERQMTFYPARLSAFYLARAVPRAAVRAEKQRIFERARSIDIRAAAPEIVFTEPHRAAVMRFRKTYAVEGGPSSRSGEVVQELRWARTPGGWKITSERDVRVIR
jgi:ketosteroid isomerase-like protein